MNARRRPPMLPTKRAHLQALQAEVRTILSASSSGRSYLIPRTVDTSTIDVGWPVVEPSLTPCEVLAGMVRARRTGRALPAQSTVRAAVVRLMEQASIRRIRLGDVLVQLGTDRLVSAGDGFELRAGGLRVTLDKPAKGRSAVPTPKKGTLGANFTRVREALRSAVNGGATVHSLADYRARAHKVG